MHDLIPLAPLPPGAVVLADAEIEAVRDYAEAQHAASTRACYERDYAIFRAWCAARGACPLPADPPTVAGFLAAQASLGGVRASTIGRRLAAIRYAHRLAGVVEQPTGSELVRATLRGIRRKLGTAPEQKAPATADVVTAMLKHCPAETLIGARDRALIALGFAGAFRRSELVALHVEDLADCADGLRVTIRHSKTDQEGQGAEVAILRGVKICPVEAVQVWLAKASITSGFVFRSVLKGGRVTATPLPAQCVALVVKGCATRAGLDARGFSGHSLRAGFCTSAAEHGASIFKMMDVSRHKSVDTLRGYVRRADSFKDHAGAGFL